MTINSAFFASLKKASWRGFPFGVSNLTLTGGRKIAVHDFPYVDGVYAEDLGLKGVRHHIVGFLVENGGAYGGVGKLETQIKDFLDVTAQYGDGDFVHPSLDLLTNIKLQEFNVEQDLRGRVAVIKMTLIKSAVKPTLMASFNTQADTNKNVEIAQQVTLFDYLLKAKWLVRTEVNGVLGMVNMFTTQINQVAFTATSLVSMVANLPGEVGRYIGSSVLTVNKDLNTTVTDLIGLGSANLVDVLGTISGLNIAVKNRDVDSIANGIVSAVNAMYLANPDPVRATSTMVGLLNLPQISTAAPVSTGWNVTNDLIRRSAVICMARASAIRQFISYDDAQSARTLICSAIDDEMLIAADQGLDGTYNALRDLKTAVAQDITRRGANLTKVMQVDSPAPVSSLVWSQRLYKDSGREAQLVQAANPIHPAFMPVSFKALST